MNVLTKKLSRVFVSVAILSGFQIMVGIAPSNAQSDEVRQELDRTNELINRGNQQIIPQLNVEEQRQISGLSCSQLSAEARELNRQGNYWSAQTNVPNYASRASGAYASAQRRLNAYNSRCR